MYCPLATMRDVDLRLAVSYLPAGLCLVKIIVLELALLMAEHAGTSSLVVIGMLIWLDRHHQCDLSIVDANNLLSSLYYAHVVNHVRDTLYFAIPHVQYLSMCEFSLCIVWTCMCLYTTACRLGILTESRSMKGARVSLEITCFYISCLAFCSWVQESMTMRIGRVVFFTCLCLFWRYAVDLQDLRCSVVGKLKIPISVLFLPVLYISSLLAVMFGMANCVLFCIRFLKLPSRLGSGSDDVSLAPILEHIPIRDETSQAQDVSHESLEQMLRDAKARLGGSLC